MFWLFFFCITITVTIPATAPTQLLTGGPTEPPTEEVPTEAPTEAPTEPPTESPTELATEVPTEPSTEGPTEAPTERPTGQPTEGPSKQPTEVPTEGPTGHPTGGPSEQPSEAPTEGPTGPSTEAPTEGPTEAPTEPATGQPTEGPSKQSTEVPTEGPTGDPSEQPSEAPTEGPTGPTGPPTERPTGPPTGPPTGAPTEAPTGGPTGPPTEEPTGPPTEPPTERPTGPPTEVPTGGPTELPTEGPTGPPTEPPTIAPTEPPTKEPTEPPPTTTTSTTTTTTGTPLPIAPNILVKNCGTDDELMFEPNIDKLQQLEADEGYLIRITIHSDIEVSSTMEFSLQVWDDSGTIGYMTHETLQPNKVIVSHKNTVTVGYRPTTGTGGSASTFTKIANSYSNVPFRLLYDCIPPTQNIQSFNYSQNNLIVMNLPSNSHFNLNYSGDPIQKFNVSINLNNPAQGFAAISLDQGRFGVTTKAVNLVLDTGTRHHTSIHIHTFNNLDNNTAGVSSDSGTITTPPPSPTTPRPTTTKMPTSQVVSVFVMGVDNLNDVMMGGMQSYIMDTFAILNSACKHLSPDSINYHDPVLCMKRCFTSTLCVELRSDLQKIPPTANCNSTGYTSLTELYRDKIKGKRSEWKKTFKAHRVTVDSCTEIEADTEWVWAVVILGVGGLFLAGGVACGVNWSGKMKRRGARRYRDDNWEMDELQLKKEGITSPWEIVDD